MISVIVPPTSNSLVSDCLKMLTKLIAENGGNVASGFLGGEFGYGAKFENATFSMHPFCWCEKDGCKYCDDGEPLFLHKPTGQGVSWYKYIGRGMEYSKEADWPAIFTECFDSIARPAQ